MGKDGMGGVLGYEESKKLNRNSCEKLEEEQEFISETEVDEYEQAYKMWEKLSKLTGFQDRMSAFISGFIAGYRKSKGGNNE